MNSANLKGIFFDAGNTLLRVHPSVGSIYAETAKKFGVDITPEKIEQTFKILWNKTAPLVDNEGHRLTYAKEKDWWKHLVQQVFEGLFETSQFEAFFDFLYCRFAEPECWRLYEDVEEILKQLKHKQYKLAIISNWDSRLPSLCEMLQISDYFDAMIVSALVGYEKPHPHIFQAALTETGLQPDEVIYIGDDPFLDYQAARKVGIQSLHLDRTDRFSDHPHRITSLRDLQKYL